MCFVAVRTFHFLGRLDGFRLYHALIALTYNKHALPPHGADKMEAFFLMLLFVRSKHNLPLPHFNSMKAFFLMLLLTLTQQTHVGFKQ
jgi:hypothetical protein